MSKLEELLTDLCPAGVNYKKIEDFATCVAGATPSKSELSYWENGTIPWMSSGEVNKREVFETDNKITQKGYDNSSTKMIPANSVVMALAGQGKTRGTVAITRIDLCTNQSLCAFVTDDTIIPEYLYHYLASQYEKLRSISNGDKDGSRGGLNLTILRNYKVPVPPIEIQKEIVRLLGRYSQLKEELEKELIRESVIRRQQYDFYREKLLTFQPDVTEKPLSNICDIKGRIGFRGYTRDDFVPAHQGALSLSPGNIENGQMNYAKAQYISTEKYIESPEIMIFENDIIFCKTGSTVGKVALVKGLSENATINPQLVVLKNISIDRRFLFHLLSSRRVQDEVKQMAGVGSVPNISQKALGSIKIPVPRINVQMRIADLLDEFEKNYLNLTGLLLKETEEISKQYCYYREHLLSFREA